ncbi:hypothetical protein DICA0_F24344 [Diutina catenulata]
MSDTKPKRKRRSYSCGPCKLLKIKCDLQVPVCSSCVKFKRDDKCLSDPAHPPSHEEWAKIQERKKRTTFKRLKQASSTSPRMQPMLPSFDPNVVFDKASQPSPPPVPSQSATPHPSQSPSEPPEYTQDPSLQASAAHDAATTMELSIVELKKIKRLLPRSWHLVEELISLYYRGCCPLVWEIMPEAAAKHDVQQVYHKLTLSSPSILDKPVSYLTNVMQSVSLSVAAMRHLSLMFALMSAGMLFHHTSASPELDQISRHLFDAISFKPDADIIADWMAMSRQLRDRVDGAASLTDVMFMLDWYLVTQTYHDYRHDAVGHFLEFNAVLSHCVLVDEWVRYVTDARDRTPLARHLGKYWLQLKLCDIDCSFFADKGTLLQGSQYRRGHNPNTQYIEYLFGGAGLPQLKAPALAVSLQIWGNYYQRKAEVQELGEFLTSYLCLYSAIARHIHESLVAFDPTSLAPPTLVALVQAMSGNYLTTRWLTFIHIEHGYFPSLRFASFLTSMLSMFNPFIVLDKNQPHFLDELTAQVNFYHFKWMYQCLVVQGLFLAALAQFRRHPNPHLSLARVYDTIHDKFSHVLSRLSSLHPVNTIPKYRDCLAIAQGFASVMSAAPVESAGALRDQVLEMLDSHSLRGVYVNYYFGSAANFDSYLHKLWELLSEVAASDTAIPVVRGLAINDAFVADYAASLDGFQFNHADVDEFVERHV